MPSQDELRRQEALEHAIAAHRLVDEATEQRDNVQHAAVLDRAIEELTKADQLAPDLRETAWAWLIALRAKASIVQVEEARVLLYKAVRKAELLLSSERGEDRAAVVGFAGMLYTGLANRSSGEEADRHFQHAYESFGRSLADDPSDPWDWFNWGVALDDQAKTKEGAAAAALFTEACDKYEKAVAIDHNNYEALHNWADALQDLAALHDADEAARLSEMAEQHLRAAAELGSYLSAWEMAETAAVKQDEDSCRHWLTRSLDLGFPEAGDRAFLQSIPWFRPFHESQWFKDLLARL